MQVKSFCKDILPPVLPRYIKKMCPHHHPSPSITWQGDYPDWQSAVATSSGYDQESIFIKVRDAARAVREGKARWERDSVLFYHEEYNWPLVAALMSVVTWQKGGSVRVLDFGGAFGSTYMQHRALLEPIDNLYWNIVELPRVVTCGKEEFSTEVLNFWPSIETCIANSPVDIILFSGVLSYVEFGYPLLEQAVALSPKAIIIDRTPFAEKGERITVQQVPAEIYPASYPCRWLDKKRVESILGEAFNISPWWQSAVDPLGFQGVMAFRYPNT